MVVAGTIGYRTASGGRLMNYDEFFADAIGRLWRERRYRVFADLERSQADFPARCGGVKEQRPVLVANLMRWGIRLRRRHCSQVRSAIDLKPCFEALTKRNQAKDPHNERMAGHQYRTKRRGVRSAAQ